MGNIGKSSILHPKIASTRVCSLLEDATKKVLGVERADNFFHHQRDFMDQLRSQQGDTNATRSLKMCYYFPRLTLQVCPRLVIYLKIDQRYRSIIWSKSDVYSISQINPILGRDIDYPRKPSILHPKIAYTRVCSLLEAAKQKQI